MRFVKRLWSFISYLGVDKTASHTDIRQVLLINRTNFIMLLMMVLVTIATSIVREIFDGTFTVHTKKLLVLLFLCIINVLLLYKKKHNLVAVFLVVLPTLIILYLPIVLSAIQITDYIYFPISLLALSIVPQIILEPRLENKIYVLSISYFFIQLFFFDKVIKFYSGIEFELILNDLTFFIYYKIILIVVFVFIHTIIFYLRAINNRFENKLLKQNLELETTISDLKNSQEMLVKSEKMASLGILTAGVAHEINNPLNFIASGVAAIEMVLKDKYVSDLPDVQPCVDAINTGIQRVSHIVRSLNKYSRSETLPYTKCNMQEVIDDCLLMVKIQYENRIEIIKNYSAEGIYVNANEGQIHQVILNLLVNAIHAIPKDGVIKIKAAEKNGEAHITISDTGTGIPEEILKHIFDPFFTTKEPGQGTGLGLSICQNIMKEHNGTISCTSEINIGTHFVLTLPSFTNLK